MIDLKLINAELSPLFQKHNIDSVLSASSFYFFENELNNYVGLLEDIDLEISKQIFPSDNTQSILNKNTKEIVEKAYGIEKELNNKSASEIMKALFRSIIWPWMKQSLIMKRALDKPRGYPGDYQMLEYIYDGKPISNGIGYYYDQGFLDSALVRSVVNRKNYIRKYLTGILSARKPKLSKQKILNLASGSCREIREMLDMRPDLDGFDLFCLDQDEEAIGFSTKMINKRANTVFVMEDIMSITKDPGNELLKDKDLIYSIGLIDYLPDRILKKLISAIYKSMKTGATLVLSHKDHGMYTPAMEDWLSDWTFIPRDEPMMSMLLEECGISKSNYQLSREDSRIIFFYEIKK